MTENLMLMCGAKITSADDRLMKITANYIADKLRNPNPDIEAKIRQLRDMRTIDEKQYREFKKQLPYIVCGWFAPAVRRTENFAYIEAFIVDLDHLQEKQVGMLSLKNLVNQDSRVMMSFTSPSEDGLKILFRLKEKCYDSGLFKVFYKVFVERFAAQYNLMQVLDAKTCDVTRACFMSVDKDVYFNPDSEPVDLNSFIDTSNPLEMFDTVRQQQREEREQSKEMPTHNQDPDAEAMEKIKRLLGVKTRRAEKKKSDIVVPEILNTIIDGLIKYIQDNGAEVYDIVNIQSAKKLKIQLGLRKAEINLFYGKRGFTVTSVPKGETDGELNEIMKQLIEVYISEN